MTRRWWWGGWCSSRWSTFEGWWKGGGNDHKLKWMKACSYLRWLELYLVGMLVLPGLQWPIWGDLGPYKIQKWLSLIVIVTEWIMWATCQLTVLYCQWWETEELRLCKCDHNASGWKHLLRQRLSPGTCPTPNVMVQINNNWWSQTWRKGSLLQLTWNTTTAVALSQKRCRSLHFSVGAQVVSASRWQIGWLLSCRMWPRNSMW